MAGDEGQRKIAAILAADVAGYSRLMADDERATVRTLTEYREVFSEHIEAHQGRIVDTAGDSVLAVFDSVVETVEAAVDIQRELAERNETLPDHRKMHFRIGVNLGDIIIRDDGTIYGDGVNVAARLEGLAAPGGLMLGEAAHMQVRGKLDLDFADAGEQEVKNIAEPVHAFALSDKAAAKRPVVGRRTLLVASAAVALVGGAVAWTLWPSPETVATLGTAPAISELPVIAVLPFENASGDNEQDYFAIGLTENLITRLSRFANLAVIARNSTAQYAGQAVDVRAVGRDLGADYVVEGSVQKLETRIRVTAQLLDADDGTHLWGEIYDRDLTTANVFEIQDEITERITGVIAHAHGIISRAQMAAIKDKPPESLNAWECTLRMVPYYDGLTPGKHAEVRDCLERAVESEPNYADAWINLGAIYRHEYLFGFNTRPNALDRALEAARRGIALAPNNDSGHMFLALIHFARGEVELFLAEAEKTLAINPNNALNLAALGSYMVYSGHPERGIAMMRRAIDLNPYHPDWYHFPFVSYYWQMGDLEAALAAVQKIDMPDFYWTHVWRAHVYGRLGRTADARESAARVLELYPGFAESAWEELGKYNMPADLANSLVEALRLAGMDIPDKPEPAE